MSLSVSKSAPGNPSAHQHLWSVLVSSWCSYSHGGKRTWRPEEALTTQRILVVGTHSVLYKSSTIIIHWYNVHQKYSDGALLRRSSAEALSTAAHRSAKCSQRRKCKSVSSASLRQQHMDSAVDKLTHERAVLCSDKQLEKRCPK